MDGWMDKKYMKNIWMVDGQKKRWMVGWIENIHEKIWTAGWIEKMDGWMDKKIDEWLDGYLKK